MCPQFISIHDVVSILSVVGQNPSATQPCKVCSIDVKVGTGEDYNWNKHVASKDHKAKRASQVKHKHVSIDCLVQQGPQAHCLF